jgi:predicted NBD/HSP70 family sugar kinase
LNQDGTFAEAYKAGNEDVQRQLHENMRIVLAQLRTALQLLDVKEVVVSGEAKKFGDGFLLYLNEALGGDKIVRFTVMGKNVQAALAGAVWLSTYSTLQEIISR